MKKEKQLMKLLEKDSIVLKETNKTIDRIKKRIRRLDEGEKARVLTELCILLGARDDLYTYVKNRPKWI